MTESLAARVEGNAQALQILNSAEPSTRKAAQLTAIGVSTSEAAVRRWTQEQRAKVGGASQPHSRSGVTVAKGWEPYAEWTDKIGSAIVRLPTPGATERDLLIASGFDPDCWKIKGSVNTRKWMRHDQEWLYYYKFDVEQGESEKSKWIHVEDLVKRIRKRSKRGFSTGGRVSEGTYVHVLSDWQIGKSESGRGTEDTVKRYKDCLAQAVENVVNLRRTGVRIDNLAIISVGDLVEGCGDHYDMQTFSVDCDRRTQNRIVRELITETILTFAPIFNHIDIVVIGGNHGENRRDGKAYTTFADNDDVGCPEAVKEAFDLAGWQDRLSWVIPGEELSLCVNIGGVNVGVVHGHQFRGGANALKKAEDWWRANDFGLQAVREAQILLSGHFHHFSATNITHGRTWIQAPTIDPGSKWYTDTSGVSAVPGVLNFVLTPQTPLGYDHVRMLFPVDSGLTS